MKWVKHQNIKKTIKTVFLKQQVRLMISGRKSCFTGNVSISDFIIITLNVSDACHMPFDIRQ